MLAQTLRQTVQTRSGVASHAFAPLQTRTLISTPSRTPVLFTSPISSRRFIASSSSGAPKSGALSEAATPVLKSASSTRTFAYTQRRSDDLPPWAKEGERLPEPAEHVAVDTGLVHDYDHTKDMSDVGHSTTGPGVGRHTKRTLSSFSMENKVCVVTGGARGLGNLFARTFVESGSNAIAIVDLIESQAQEAADDLVKWFVEHGEAQPNEIQAAGFGCDVSDEEQVKKTFERIVEKFGKVDSVVASAGIVHNYSALEYPTEKMRQVFRINVEGAFFTAREAAKHMLAAGTQTGSIVLVGSMSGHIINVPQPQTPYNSSKAAVKHMASSLAVEWAQSGIRVNSLAPGYMLTALTKNILDANPALREKWESLTPMGRIGLPEDLKGAIVYLCSDASGFTTGQDLVVDGGYMLT